MKKGLKKALGLLVALRLMVVGSAFSALAADSPEQRQTFSVDLNNFDESQPYSETLHFEKDGQPVTVTLSYTPPLTRDPATEGTWKSDAFWGVAGMDYRFDLAMNITRVVSPMFHPPKADANIPPTAPNAVKMAFFAFTKSIYFINSSPLYF